MTLTIHTEEDAQRQLKVTVEVPEERVEEQMRRSARQIGRGVNIPGFRPGKVPYRVLVQRIGREALRSEAVEELLVPVFEETMAQIETTPYAQPSLDDVQTEPLVLELTIPMEPVVELGDYRSLRKEIEPVEVTDEALDEALQRVRERHEVLEPVARPAMSGDVVTLSGVGEVIEEESTEVIFDEERIELLLDAETTFPGTDFVDNIIGMEVGDEGEFSITFPEDSEDESLRDKEAAFSVTVLDVKSRYLPELDDELAREEGDYETLDDLREALREELEEQAEQQARDDLFDSVMEELLEGATLVYSPIVVSEELERIIDNLKDQVTRSGWQWEDYMLLQGETEESLREEWQERAEEQVRRGLALRKFVEQERLAISEEDLEEAIEERLERFEENEELRDQMREFFQQGQGLEMLSSQLVMDKVHERMEAIVTGNAPSFEELEAAEAEAEAEAAAEEEE
ncbi:MAG TPA: trigger factor [Candidatus Sulfomarinibacteraceae bacterium]|nr:trigger factor [Candidatus Sulfomarinibacteraceae bacterium]